MKGKKRCKILKEIRQAIADENGIEYVTTECKHKGDCAGTCPKCEQEVRYLEEELKKKQSLGKKIAVIGVAASVALSGAGCDDMLNQPTAGDPEFFENWGNNSTVSSSTGIVSSSSFPEIQGDMPEESYPDESEYLLDGDIALPDDITESSEASED